MAGDAPLRIAVIGMRGLPSDYSGIERAAENLYPRLADHGHRITVYSRAAESKNVSNIYRGIHLVSMPAIRARSMETLSHAAISLAHALMCGHFDVIHLHALAPGLLSVIRRVSAVPVVVTVHGLDWRRAKWRGCGSMVLRFAERMIARHASEIIVVSRDLQLYFRRTYNRDVSYIPNGVDPPKEAVDPPIGLERFGLSAKRYFAYIGRLVPEKRIEDLICAYRNVDTPQRLAIVGEGRYADSYVKHLRQCASADTRVTFTGSLQGPALGAVFRNATAFVLPSEVEGLPMALLESMNYGTPAIASDIPPHRELLEAVSGYDLFFRPGDVTELTDRLRRMITSPDGYRTCAARARDHVRAAYSWSKIAAQTEAVLKQAVGSTVRHLGRHSYVRKPS